jgi:hypothetical protein
MNPIFSNPYRIIGLLSNVSEKEIQKQKSKLSRYISVGKKLDSKYQFIFLGGLDDSDINISNAFAEIEQNWGRVFHSLFWFINLNSLDEIALEYLVNEQKELAQQSWEKITTEKSICQDNFSAFNNISTLYLLDNSIEVLKVGIEIKIQFIQSPHFENFVLEVADQTFSNDQKKIIENFCDAIFSLWIDVFSTTEILYLFKDTGDIAYSRIESLIVDDPIYRIETEINSTKKNRKSEPENSLEFGMSLYESCKLDIELIERVLHKNHLKFKFLADNLALEIAQCAIDYYNAVQTDENNFEKILSLLNHAKDIAVGAQSHARINSNIEALLETKDKEISLAIEFMKSIEKTYEENRMQIRNRVMSMKLGPNQEINWTKVNKACDDSIDWDKVVQLLNEIIPKHNIEKIKSIKNSEQTKEFKRLVEFIFSKLSLLQITRVSYLNYWKKEGAVPHIKFLFTSLPLRVKLLIYGLMSFGFLVLIVRIIWGFDGVKNLFTGIAVVGILYLISTRKKR